MNKLYKFLCSIGLHIHQKYYYKFIWRNQTSIYTTYCTHCGKDLLEIEEE